MNKNLPLVLLVVIIAVVVGAYYYFTTPSGPDDIVEMMTEKGATSDPMNKPAFNKDIQVMMKLAFDYSGGLEDVTFGKDVRGINTGGASTGLAKAGFVDGTYNLLVTFENLPEPAGTDFYEGWIVRKGLNFDVISTGVVQTVNGVYTNIYKSGDDLTGHSFYVLTLEPDDGDPAPADHIVEGTLRKVSP